MNTNFNFYQRTGALQKQFHEKESESIAMLDQEGFAASTKSKVDLQRYWESIVLAGDHQHKRNRFILTKLEKIEDHLTSLSSKTEALGKLRVQYNEALTILQSLAKQDQPVFRENIIQGQQDVTSDSGFQSRSAFLSKNLNSSASTRDATVQTDISGYCTECSKKYTTTITNKIERNTGFGGFLGEPLNWSWDEDDDAFRRKLSDTTDRKHGFDIGIRSPEGQHFDVNRKLAESSNSGTLNKKEKPGSDKGPNNSVVIQSSDLLNSSKFSFSPLEDIEEYGNSTPINSLNTADRRPNETLSDAKIGHLDSALSKNILTTNEKDTSITKETREADTVNETRIVSLKDDVVNSPLATIDPSNDDLSLILTGNEPSVSINVSTDLKKNKKSLVNPLINNSAKDTSLHNPLLEEIFKHNIYPEPNLVPDENESLLNKNVLNDNNDEKPLAKANLKSHDRVEVNIANSPKLSAETAHGPNESGMKSQKLPIDVSEASSSSADDRDGSMLAESDEDLMHEKPQTGDAYKALLYGKGSVTANIEEKSDSDEDFEAMFAASVMSKNSNACALPVKQTPTCTESEGPAKKTSNPNSKEEKAISASERRRIQQKIMKLGKESESDSDILPQNEKGTTEENDSDFDFYG